MEETSSSKWSADLKDNDLYFHDGGIETAAIFLEGLDLPEFALCATLDRDANREFARKWYTSMLVNAKEAGATGFVVDTPTFRSSLTWAKKLGLGENEFKRALENALNQCKSIVSEHKRADFPVLLCGVIGPAGCGFDGNSKFTAEEAKGLHSFEVDVFRVGGVDYAGAICIASVEEAIGIVQACKDKELPVMVSFTVETDGNLPSGMSLQEAIEATDAATGQYPLYYQLNCAHFDHFNHLFTAATLNENWVQRIRAIRPNASRKSHDELDESTELDAGDPIEFGQLFAKLKGNLPHMQFIGGCCGTDLRHLRQAGQALAPWMKKHCKQ